MYYQKVTDLNKYELYVDGENIIIENNSEDILQVYLNDFILFELNEYSTINLNNIKLVGFLKFKNLNNENLNFKFLIW